MMYLRNNRARRDRLPFRGAAATAIAMATSSLAHNAQAGLFTELRAASVDPAHASFVVIQSDKKHVNLLGPAAAGATITMQIWSTVSGFDANFGNDGLLSLAASFLSTHVNGGAAHGSLSASRQVSITGLNQTSGFNGSGGFNGTQTDLNGDGELDVGSNNDGDSTGFFAARATSAPDPVFATDPPGEILIGSVRYVVNSVTGTNFAQETDVNLRKRESFGGATWYEDLNQDPNNDFNFPHVYPADPNWSVGSPVVFVAPEPCLGATVLPAILLTDRRRRRRRS
jgi:hypothetical protein